MKRVGVVLLFVLVLSFSVQGLPFSCDTDVECVLYTGEGECVDGVCVDDSEESVVDFLLYPERGDDWRGMFLGAPLYRAPQLETWYSWLIYAK